MEIVKIASEWAKAEIFSAKVFMLFGIVFIVAAIGFWQLGKTELARAFIFPTLIAGALLLVAGIGFYFGNTSRLSNFETDYTSNPASFIQSEIARADKTMNEYNTVAFKVFPAIIILSSVLIIFLNGPIWRSICMIIIAFFVIVLLIDSHANERMKNYHDQLLLIEKNLSE